MKTIKITLLCVTFAMLAGACGPQQIQPPDPNDNNYNEYKMNKDLTTPKEGDTIAKIKTNKGEIKILLFTEKAPKTAENFIELAKQGKYNNVVFHRVIKDFMIQTGDFENANGTGGYSYKGPGTTIGDEFDDELVHVKGGVSMANRGPNTGGSQFFIVQAEEGTPWLDGMHAIFGYVYEGIEVVDEIGNLETFSDKPTEDIIMESVEIEKF